MFKSYTIARKTSYYLSKAAANNTKSDLIEIVARLLQYQNNPADIPAYLRHDLLEWLRNHE